MMLQLVLETRRLPVPLSSGDFPFGDFIGDSYNRISNAVGVWKLLVESNNFVRLKAQATKALRDGSYEDLIRLYPVINVRTLHP